MTVETKVARYYTLSAVIVLELVLFGDRVARISRRTGTVTLCGGDKLLWL